MVYGRPLDFRATLKHINTHAAFPALQRKIRFVTSKVFPQEDTPLVFRSPFHDTEEEPLGAADNRMTETQDIKRHEAQRVSFLG